MYLDHVTRDGDSSRHRAKGHGLVKDIWDLLGYAAVIGLAVCLWIGREATSDSGIDPSPETQATFSSDTSIVSDSTIQQSRTGRRAVGAAAWTHSDTDLLADSVGAQDSGAAEKAINRLAILQQRPEWTLLPGDIAVARQDLALLIEQGDAAIPAIRIYLGSSSGIDINSDSVIEQLGYGSLRLALFDVLRHIGGSQTEAIWYEQLNATESPVEIETLGRYLEETSPGLYHREILNAARHTFTQATDDGVHGQDLGPLFQVFSEYGDAALIPELEQVSQLRWGRYAAVTLASLPEGSGIRSLAGWVSGASPNNTSAYFSLRVLAQSADYPEAGQALLQSMQESRIKDTDWPEFTRLISGTYHIQLYPPRHGVISRREGAPISHIVKSTEYIALTPGGGQIIYGLHTGSPVLTTEQVVPRLELIEAMLLQAKSPVARRELKNAFNTLWSLHIKQDE